MALLKKISVRTARRLLQRLALEGFVSQAGGHRRRYSATLRLAALGRQMLDHAHVARAAEPRVAQLGRATGAIAHLWIAGYAEQVVCAVHADGRADSPAVLILSHVASAPSSAPGTVLLSDRARLRSCCYVHLEAEPMFGAAVLQHGQVIAALGITGDRALDANAAVVDTGARLSMDLAS